MGASRGMMVLLVKQVHLQKEVGARERGGMDVSWGGAFGWGRGGKHVQAADVRVERAERERMRMGVGGSMARGGRLVGMGVDGRGEAGRATSRWVTCQSTLVNDGSDCSRELVVGVGE